MEAGAGGGGGRGGGGGGGGGRRRGASLIEVPSPVKVGSYAQQFEAGALEVQELANAVLIDSQGRGAPPAGAARPPPPSGSHLVRGMQAGTGGAEKALPGAEGPLGAKGEPRSGEQTTRWATDQEVTDYAEYIGMDAASDAPLLWIAEQAACTPLPRGWVEMADHTGRPFFFNRAAGVASYEHPNDKDFRALYALLQGTVWDVPTKDEVRDMADYLGIDEDTEPELMWVARQAFVAPLGEDWQELEDDSGEPYFYSPATGESSYSHPLDATFRLLLKMEREKIAMGHKSIVGAAHLGGEGGDEPLMRLAERDGMAVYTYNWAKNVRSEERQLVPAAKPEAPRPPAAELEALKQDGILASAAAAGAPPPVTPPRSDSPVRMPMISRKATTSSPGLSSPKARLRKPGFSPMKGQRPKLKLGPEQAGGLTGLWAQLVAFFAALLSRLLKLGPGAKRAGGAS